MEKSSVSLKLLIDRRGRRVLFAEAGKDVVDFLFHLLSLPVATIVRLLRHQGIKGSLPKLYNSLENLDTTYIETGKNKDTFLKPVSHSSVMLLGICHNAHTPNKSSYNCTDAPSDGGYSCPSPRYRCSSDDDETYGCDEDTYDDTYMCNTSVELKEESSGLVKGVVTYMVMDDLEVKPMSTISSLTLLNKFNVKDVGDLEEKVVKLGMDEGIKLLKTSLQSKNVLTDVFC